MVIALSVQDDNNRSFFFFAVIVVVVAIDTVTQVQTRLMSSQYEQLVKKTKFGR